MSVVSVAAAGVGLTVGANTLLGNPLGLGGGQQGTAAQNMVDPFAPYRQSYAALLNQYMGLGVGGPSGGAPTGAIGTLAGGSPLGNAALRAPAGGGTAPGMTGISPTFGINDPAYQAALGVGLQGVQRANPGASGNELLALQNYGITYQQSFQNQMFDKLAMLSGASTSPMYGGKAGIDAANLASANQSAGIGSMMAGLQGLGKYFGPSGGTNPDQGVNINSGVWSTGNIPQTFMNQAPGYTPGYSGSAVDFMSGSTPSTFSTGG